MTIIVSSFYRFAALADPVSLRQSLMIFCRSRDIRGTVLLAAEGINGTIAGRPNAISETLSFLRSQPGLGDLESKDSGAYSMPFGKLKIRLKTEIVSLRVPGVDPTRQVGCYVEPEAWNELIADPETLVIDTRNSFEFALGSFKNATDPKTSCFSEFPDFVQRNLGDAKERKIAMFCTGGIRCEKATSFLVAQGYTQVYHLKGGILKYLEEIPPEQSLWRGQCFVFDERISLGHGLSVSSSQLAESEREINDGLSQSSAPTR